MPIATSKQYIIVTTRAGAQTTVQDITIEIIEANFNLSVFCYRFTDIAKPAEGYPTLKMVITLVSFDGTTADSRCAGHEE